jgi:hypothetical protein
VEERPKHRVHMTRRTLVQQPRVRRIGGRRICQRPLDRPWIGGGLFASPAGTVNVRSKLNMNMRGRSGCCLSCGGRARRRGRRMRIKRNLELKLILIHGIT